MTFCTTAPVRGFLSHSIPVTGLAYLGKPNRIQEYPSGRTLGVAAVPWDTAVSPDGRKLFAAHYALNGFVSVVDAASLTSLGTVSVGTYPVALAFKPAALQSTSHPWRARRL